MLAVRAAAQAAKFVFRQQTEHDFGVDLHLEVTDERGDATGRLIAIQVKSGESYFSHAHPDGWWFYVSDRHRRYWLNHSLPVVLALHNATTKTTYWAQVSPDTIVPTNRAGSKILVPSTQVLDDSGFTTLRYFAERTGPVSTGAVADSPGRHRVVLKQAMEAAARDDAYTAFEHWSAGMSPLVGETTYHMGDPMGRYVLTAYREFDQFLALVLVVEHLTRLNELLSNAGGPTVSLKSLLMGFAVAMPSDTTKDELDGLKSYIAENASAYWGGPL